MRLTTPDAVVVQYVVTCAILREDRTWDTKEIKIQASNERTACREAVAKAEKLSEIGLACMYNWKAVDG